MADSSGEEPLGTMTKAPAPADAAAAASGLFKLWPPSDATRVAVAHKMALKLSSACFESQSFPRIELADAEVHAKRIEEEAFGAAQAADQRGEDAGSGVVMVYARHASKMMLETLRSQSRENGEPVTPTVGRGGARDNGTATNSGERQANGDNAGPVDSREQTNFDVSGGTRAFLTEETAEELLRPLLAPGNSFTHVCLSNWSFGHGSAEVAARALAPLKHRLVDVNLADIVAGRPEAEALNAMTTISVALGGSRLKSLNLSDNALGEKGVRAFSALLSSQDSLHSLYFMNNGISEEAAHAIAELLPSAKELRTLCFHNNMSGDKGAEELAAVVAQATLLERFQMSSSRVGSDGAIVLMESLQDGKSLRSIDLRDNMYGVEAGLALAKTLRLHTSLREVYLSDLNLEDEAALAVVEALTESASQLEVLELGGNEITQEVAPALATCIRSLKYLTRLNLMENELKDKGVVTISNAVKGAESLRELDLCVNELGRIGAVAAAQAVANKKGFKALNLNGNSISEAGIEAVQEVFAKSAAGAGVLGPLDENEEEDQEDEEEDEENGDEENGDEENGDEDAEVEGLSDLEVA